MNSELLKVISESLTKLKKEKREIVKELKALKVNEDYLTSKGRMRLSELYDHLAEIEEELKCAQEDYNSYDELCKKSEELKQLVDAETKPETKKLLQDLYDEKLEVLGETEKELSAYYTVPKEEKTDEPVFDAVDENKKEEKEEKEEKANNKNKRRSHKIRNIILVCGGISLVFSIVGLVKGCVNAKNNVNSNQLGIYQQYDGDSDDDLDLTYDDSLDVYDVNIFNDITDEDKLSTRAAMLIKDLDKNNPGHDFSVEELENIMKWINGGIPEEISQEEALYAISRVEVLMNRENQQEVDRVFDVSKLFLDGSNGQKLAEKIYFARVNMLDTLGKREFDENAQDFGKLIAESWYLNGANNEISAWALETSGMEALIDKYFLNTITIAQSGKDTSLMVVVPNYGEFSLETINKEINALTCPAIVTADNGETFETMMNKFSSDMIGMVTESTLHKQNSSTLSLTNNN